MEARAGRAGLGEGKQDGHSCSGEGSGVEDWEVRPGCMEPLKQGSFLGKISSVALEARRDLRHWEEAGLPLPT